MAKLAGKGDVFVASRRFIKAPVWAVAATSLAAVGMIMSSATALADKLTTGTWTHDYGIGAEEAKQLGLPISTDMPEEVYDFMALFPQPTRTRPAVEYLPMPYRGARQGRQ